MLEPAYIEILDTNKELRKELANEIADNDSREKKIASLNKELESCYNTISHYDSLIIAHEEEIASLKSEISSLKKRLYTALQDAHKKEEHDPLSNECPNTQGEHNYSHNDERQIKTYQDSEHNCSTESKEPMPA